MKKSYKVSEELQPELVGATIVTVTLGFSIEIPAFAVVMRKMVAKPLALVSVI